MTNLFKLTCFILFIVVLSSCKQNSTTLTGDQSVAVKDSVLKLANITAQDVSTKGPIAWLDHFEDTPDFFMASGGSMALPDYQTAESFIKNKLVKVMPKITLKWSAIRVDPLTPRIAVMAADFHEDTADATGKVTPYDGYFTAVVEETEKGWKFRNEHWSIKAPK